MGLFLLLLLSCFFGYCFSEAKNRRIEELKLQLQLVNKKLDKTKEQHEFEKRLLRNTIRELL